MQAVNVLMFSILLVLMLMMTMNSNTHLNNTPIVRGKDAANSNVFFSKATVRNDDRVTEEGKLKEKLKLEEDHEDPPRTVFKVKSVYPFNSVN